MTTTEALSEFVGAADVASQRGVIVDLVKSKRIHDVASDDTFREGLDRVAAAVRTGAPGDRLTAIATLERSAAVSKPLRPVVDELLRRAVVEPLENLHALKDADDRLYAARSWRAVRNGELYLDLLATAAVREEMGEAIRKECVEGVVELSTDVTAALDMLRAALVEMKFPTKKPGDSLGRRLKRILQVVADTLAKSHRPVGQRVGRALALFVERTVRVHGRPESVAVRNGIVERTAALVHEIVRSGFSLAAEHRTYEALAVAQEWFKPHEWRDLCGSVWMERVTHDVREALLLLARLEQTDDDLRRALETVCGSPGEADAVCRELATESPDISQDVRDWLVKAPRRIQSANAVESQTRSIDAVLAEVLLDMEGLSRTSDVVKSDVLPEVSTVLPRSEAPVRRLTGRADAMVNTLKLAMDRRSLRVRKQEVGQAMEFSPREHRLEGAERRTRRVRLIRPAVEKLSEDGVPHVVLKAVVEPVTGDAGRGSGGAR